MDQAGPSEDAQLLREMSGIVGRDHKPRPATYWTDFAVSVVVSYGAMSLFLFAPSTNLPIAAQVLAWIVAALALFRLGTFIHEIQHFRRDDLRGFTAAWNLAYGIPFLMPSFMYKNHGDHHSLRKYGTTADGEYLPLATGSRRALAAYFAEIPLLPILSVLRFAVLVPPSLVSRGARRWLMERASSYGINLRYRRDVDESELYGWSVWADAAGATVVYGVLGLLLSGALPWNWLLRVYLIATTALGLNWIRTLFAHRYRRAGEAGGRLDQLADSVTVSGSGVWTELLFPVGLRYHSLHHLFPTLPYHALGSAHRRLMTSLPADSPYRATVVSGVADAWRSLSNDLRGAEREAAGLEA